MRPANDRNFLRIPGLYIVLYGCIVPTVACVACILCSMWLHFELSTRTHCRVRNYLPSISSAIGGYTPQRYIWRIAIALHIAPRVVVSILYYNFYTHSTLNHHTPGWVQPLAGAAALLHFLENMSLLTLSYVSSTENYDIHEGSFYLFIGFSQLYMIITLVLFNTTNSQTWTMQAYKSFRAKVGLWLFNLACLLGAGYFFFRHNSHCEPGVYTLFALCEYLVVLSNIAFHGSAAYDFGDGHLSFTLPALTHKQD